MKNEEKTIESKTTARETVDAGKKQPLLSVQDLAVSFFTHAGEVQAVRHASWDLYEGETIALVGESGCGKTVSIQTSMGLLQSPGRVKTGKVLFEGEDLVGKTPQEMRLLQGDRMSMIFQDPLTFLNPTMKVGRQIAEGYLQHHKATRAEVDARVLKMMKMVSFPNPERNMNCYPYELSGGMRQRIMVAMALICNPKVLFADEPTTALDVTIQAQIIELMNSLKSQLGTSIVLITHDLGVVANMAQRIYVMYAGTIVEHGDAQSIFYQPKHPYTWGLLDSVPRLDSQTKSDMLFIPGTPPDLIKPPAGCPFAARCRFAMNICTREAAPKYVFEKPDHFCTCHLYNPAVREKYRDIIENRGHENAE